MMGIYSAEWLPIICASACPVLTLQALRAVTFTREDERLVGNGVMKNITSLRYEIFDSGIPT